MEPFRIKSDFEIKDIDEKAGIVTGYASIFGNIDSDNDMIMQGSFTKTCAERGPASSKPRIKHLWQHNSWEPIAVPIELREDGRGLYFASQFGKDQFSQDKLQQHIDKIITELSIGFNTIKAEDIINKEGEVTHRKITEIKLWEYSSVTWGSNSLTEVLSAKGELTDTLAELNKRIDTLTKALKNGKYSDETAESFEAELSKIQNIIKSLPLKEPERSTPEIVKPTNVEILQTILNSLKNE